MNKLFFFYLFLSLILTSCIEIIDDLTIHNDGSGTFKYTVNLSSSKVKANSILALDSIEGKKVPSKSEIKTKINTFAAKLKIQSGISNVIITINDVDLIIKLSCDFTSVSSLQDGLKVALLAISKSNDNKEWKENWVSFDGKVLNRNIPLLSMSLSDQIRLEDLNLLKTGSYTSINRFDRAINKVEKTSVKINPSKTACMLKVNTYDLQKNFSLIDNCIYLSPLKNK